MPIEKRPLLERMMERVRVQNDGCWVWLGSQSKGYGKIWVDGKLEQVHRASYVAHIGPIPTGLHLDHLCRNRACVNPAHLEAVTNRENILRGTGPTAMHAAKTHCLRGHPLSGENLYLQQKPAGPARVCRECQRAAHRKWLARG